MTTQPSGFVGWTTSANPLYIVEPTAGQKTTGWVSGEAPPFQYLNWMFYMLDQWTQFLAPAMTDGAPSIPATPSVLTTTGTLTNDSNQLTALASVVGLVPGLLITGSHILPGTFIQSISGSDVTMSTKATSASLSQNVVFSQAVASGVTVQAQIQQHDTAIKMMVPVGAIFATFPKLAGAYICTATTVADAAGLVLCAGQTIADSTSPMNGVTVPNINDSCFIMGLAAGGDGAGGGNQVSGKLNLSHSHTVGVNGNMTVYSFAMTMPAHTHNLTNVGGASIFVDVGGGIFYNANGPSFTDANWISAAYGGYHSVSKTSVGLVGVTSAITSAPVSYVTSTGSNSMTGSTDTVLGSSIEIRPKYITAVHLMKIK